MRIGEDEANAAPDGIILDGPVMEAASNLGIVTREKLADPESYAFADSIISNGTPWCVQQSVNLSSGVAEVVFQSSKTLDQAKLVSTLNGGFTGDRTWIETTASVVDNGGGSYTLTATLPQYTTAWFINGISGTLVASSDYQETDEPPPSNVVYDVTANWSSKTVNGNDAVTITNGATVTLENAVCRRAWESKGEIRTRRCTPSSALRWPNAKSPLTVKVAPRKPASSPAC